MKVNKIGIIIGVQKGGTSSLFKYLSQHPQVSECKIKETDFFLKDSKWTQGFEYYEDLWEWDPEKHLVALEASPNYTVSFDAVTTTIQRIQTIDREFKFIYILRDPIQKIESMRVQGTYHGWYSPLLAKETLDSVPLEVIESVRYATIADKFTQSFSKDSLLLLKTDGLNRKNSPELLMNEACRFLDIDSSFKFNLETIHNARNSYRKDTAWKFLTEAKYAEYLRSVWKIFPTSLKENARTFLKKPFNKQKVVPPLTKEQKEFIRDALKDEVRKLELEYGLNLASWNL